MSAGITDTDAGPGTGTATATATGPTLSTTARSARGPLLVVLALVLVGLLVAAFTARGPSGRLDPDSYGPNGARAIAEVLRRQGVDVERVDTVAAVQDQATPKSVVMITEPAALADSELELLGSTPAALLVVGGEDQQLTSLGVPAETAGAVDVSSRRAACTLPAAERAGQVELGGLTYSPTGGVSATGCYATGGDASLLVLTERRAVLLGDGQLFTNDRVDEQGNASLALDLLGAQDRVLWLVPRPGRPIPAGERGSFSDLIPDSVFLGALQLFLALGVLALWRARRLGRVVQEPLPVIVRAAEAVEGRSRLYRAAGARDVAAASLRAASRERLARRVGLLASAPRTALVEMVSERVGGDTGVVEALLYGDAPGDDDALVRLADRLRTLEATVSGDTGA